MQDSTKPDNGVNSTMATGIGETLREAREEQGLSLQDAAAETRIRATHLEALEREEFDHLGGDVYVRGFIRSYAKAIGIDAEPLLQQHQSSQPPRIEQPPPKLAREPLERSPRRGLGVLAAVVALAGIAGIAILSGDSGEPAQLDDDPATAPGDVEPDPETAQEDEPAPADADPEPDGGVATPTQPSPATGAESDATAPPPVDGVRVVVDIGDRDVWLRALVDGDEVLQETLSAGASETFEADEEVRLRIGDAGAVELTVNGEAIDSPGGSGQPVWVTIDADGDVTVG